MVVPGFLSILSKIRICWCISRNIFNILFNECSFSGSWIITCWQTDRQAYIVRLFYIFLQILLWMYQKTDYNESTVQINCENLDERECQSQYKCKLLKSILNFDAQKFSIQQLSKLLLIKFGSALGRVGRPPRGRRTKFNAKGRAAGTS
jgi:hypothetical protein